MKIIPLEGPSIRNMKGQFGNDIGRKMCNLVERYRKWVVGV